MHFRDTRACRDLVHVPAIDPAARKDADASPGLAHEGRQPIYAKDCALCAAGGQHALDAEGDERLE